MRTYLYFICFFIPSSCCCNNTKFILNNDSSLDCDVLARTHLGWVCGRVRTAEGDVKYASFRRIQFAKQPVGELRFKPLQPLNPWTGVLVTTEDGPICPQYDEVYGRLARPIGMSECCIHINVHVPLTHVDVASNAACHATGLPIIVYAHGGGFEAGSGNSDLYGPEYLCHEGVIVITFNHRLNVFGFLSLNTSKIPGNNGIRDTISVLEWVQCNARAFGGDPDNVTLAGHSTGSVIAHLISLSNANVGLFKRLILMSGLAIGGFFTTSPAYAAEVAALLVKQLGINCTDPDDIHDQLVKMPLEEIMEANRILQFKTGAITFAPVVEYDHVGVTRIIDDEPENLMKQGRGKDLPMIVGFTRNECEFFRRRVKYLDLVGRINENSKIILPANIIYSASSSDATYLAKLTLDKYFEDGVTVDNFLKHCNNYFYKYAAFKVAELRASVRGAPMYLYQYSFDSDFNPVKAALMLNYEGGGGHAEDMTFMFRANSMLDPDEKSLPPRSRDDLMKYWMTTFVVNFMKCSHPLCDNKCAWPPVDAQQLNFHDIHEPALIYDHSNMTDEQRDMYQFFNHLYDMAKNHSTSST